MSLLLAAILLSSSHQVAEPPAAPLAPRTTTDPTALAKSPQVAAALAFLALVDAGDWKASYAKTGKPFRKLNTVEVWAEVSEKVRVPLGKAVSRTPASEEMIPAPPAGYQMVKFETNFANKANMLEIITLIHEGDDWKVVGYIID